MADHQTGVEMFGSLFVSDPQARTLVALACALLHGARSQLPLLVEAPRPRVSLARVAEGMVSARRRCKGRRGR
jgi:hypothetical protein